MLGFVLVTEDVIKLGIVERTDLGYLIGSSGIYRDLNIDESMEYWKDGTTHRKNGDLYNGIWLGR